MSNNAGKDRQPLPEVPEEPGDANLIERTGGTIFLAILAIPFASEGAKRVIDHEYFNAGFCFFIAVPLAVAAIVWLYGGKTTHIRFRRMATDPRWWISILLVILLYFGASHIQFGKEGTRGEQGPLGSPGTEDARVPAILERLAEMDKRLTDVEKIAKEVSSHRYLTIGDDLDLWEGHPLAIAWRAALLRALPSQHSREYRFSVNARNSGDDPIVIKDAYIQSLINSARIKMRIADPGKQNEPFDIEDTAPVPPGVQMFLIVDFSDGTSQDILLREWGSFHVVVEYDNNKLEKKKFERDWVVRQFIASDPDAQPHVSKKK
jgi:hypothetical protein